MNRDTKEDIALFQDELAYERKKLPHRFGVGLKVLSRNIRQVERDLRNAELTGKEDTPCQSHILPQQNGWRPEIVTEMGIFQA